MTLVCAVISTFNNWNPYEGVAVGAFAFPQAADVIQRMLLEPVQNVPK